MIRTRYGSALDPRTGKKVRMNWRSLGYVHRVYLVVLDMDRVYRVFILCQPKPEGFKPIGDKRVPRLRVLDPSKDAITVLLHCYISFVDVHSKGDGVI